MRMSDASVREFISRVMPWPSGHGHVNLHWRTPDPRNSEKDFWHGKPSQNVGDFMGLLSWVRRQPQTKDIYFCLSLQSQISKNKRGNTVAVRSKTNALFLKSIWLDIDIKDPPKGYSSLDEALAALEAFCSEYKLPSPTALVGSGGGLHVYWISNRPLAPDEWQSYASGLRVAVTKFGLRCDAGCTIDSARVLRVPDTFNYKTTPPRPVKLLAIKDAAKDYDFEERFKHIRDLSPAPRPSIDLANFPKLAGAVESLSDGIEKSHLDTPLPWNNVYKGCAFVRTALDTGGKDYTQPEWNLTTLLATFMDKGHEAAHLMSSGHPEYDAASTEELWERKVRERETRGLGWPSCNAIQAAGCSSCASCPHLAKGKSPLNLAVSEIKTDTTLDVLNLPGNYVLDNDGQPCVVKYVKGVPQEPVPVFFNRLALIAPWTQANPDVFHFYAYTQGDKAKPKHIQIQLVDMLPGNDLGHKLQQQSIKVNPKARSFCEDFLVSWMAKLEAAIKAQENQPYGWMREKTEAEGEKEAGAKIGFCYGGVAIHKGGNKTPSGYGRPRLRDWYSPTGSIQPWYDACKLITDQKRPELDAIIAASFATPLVNVQGQSGIMFSAHGIASGQGKSSAAQVGMAIWGHTKKTKAVPTSTLRQILEVMGEINNLPIFWDEITDDKVRQRLYDIVYSLNEGVSGGRLNQSADIKDRGTWATALITCSNHSFVDYITRQQKNTNSAHYRVLEWEVPEVVGGSGKLATEMDAGKIFAKLEYNYGSMGLKFSELLGTDPDRVDKIGSDWNRKFHSEMQAIQPERFWTGGCSAMLAGAQLANEIGAGFDMDRLYDFLKAVFQKNRERVAGDTAQTGSERGALDMLIMYFKERIAETLRSKQMLVKAGRVKNIEVISNPAINVHNLKPVQIHWGIEPRLCRISRSDFRAFLEKREISYRPVMQGLKAYYNATDDTSATLGGGSSFGIGIERVIEIPVPVGSPLEEWMLAPLARFASTGEIA